MKINVCYKCALWLDCFLIIFNVCMVALSVFKQKVHDALTNQFFCRTKSDVVMVAGSPKENRLIYGSAPHEAKTFLFCPLKKEEKDRLYNEGIEYLTLPEEKLLKRVSDSVKPSSEYGVCNIFINTGDDAKNIALSNHIIARIRKLEKLYANLAYEKLAVYVFGTTEKKNLFLELEERGFGCFHYVDEYRLAVLDLIENHPMASFFSERHVDYETTTVKKVRMKVFMIGFGKTNSELFIQSVSNDQFVTYGDGGKPVHKCVEYFLFDRKKILENSNLNYSYNRYSAFKNRLEHDGFNDQYLDIAPLPAEEHLIAMQDVDSKSFFHVLHENLAKDENDINLISVSLGEDIDSVDIANKIVSKCREWGLDNTHVCARVRNRKESENIASTALLLWGDCRESVFNYSAICRKNLEKMAMIHDGIYEQYKSDGCRSLKCQRIWFEKSRIERESSFNVCLNLKTKLYLMGLGSKRLDGEGKTLSAKEIREAVRKLSDEAKDNMARQEHYRWNAHYICSGYVPVSINEIKRSDEHGKNRTLRKHPNLLEFDALRDYQNLTGTNVIQYDKQAINELADTLGKFMEVYCKHTNT